MDETSHRNVGGNADENFHTLAKQHAVAKRIRHPISDPARLSESVRDARSNEHRVQKSASDALYDARCDACADDHGHGGAI